LIDKQLQQAVALHQQGQLGRAKHIYDEILRVQPRHFAALHLSGVIAAQTGDPAAAVEIISMALEIAPGDAIAHQNRGLALRDLGQWDAALANYDRAVALAPTLPEPHYHRGNLFKERLQWGDALEAYERAIALKPLFAEAHCHRGICLVALKRLESALASYDQAIAIQASYFEAHYNRGSVLCQLRRWEDAIDSFDRAIRLRPGHAQVHSNRAFALQELGRSSDALASAQRALDVDPKLVDGHVNSAGVLLRMGRVDEALTSYDRAIALAPARASLYVNRGLARLSTGDYSGGWADYEWRWQDLESWVIQERRNFPQRRWRGEMPVDGKSVLLHAEQGYGDTIQFCRYATLLAERGAQVILEVQSALASLAASVAGVSSVTSHGQPPPPFDYYSPLLSLPLAMQTRLEDIPATVPYLAPSEAHRRRWRELLGGRRTPRVGLVWSGGCRPGRPELWSMNTRRNVPLRQLHVLDVPGVEFYSLQKGQAAEAELAELEAGQWDGPRIMDMTHELHDFADTAALIEQLDLVISVDTATAHLAGALGKPVWILNRFDACWRWLRERSDSPWYPTARLYRQERPGEWDGVLERVKKDLIAFVGG
jgi:tetratricopeptide (TPR) repeat protein